MECAPRLPRVLSSSRPQHFSECDQRCPGDVVLNKRNISPRVRPVMCTWAGQTIGRFRTWPSPAQIGQPETPLAATKISLRIRAPSPKISPFPSLPFPSLPHSLRRGEPSADAAALHAAHGLRVGERGSAARGAPGPAAAEPKP